MSDYVHQKWCKTRDTLCINDSKYDFWKYNYILLSFTLYVSIVHTYTNVFHQLCSSKRTVRVQSQSYANTAALLTNCWLWIRNGLDLNLFDNLIGTVREFTRKLKTGNKYFLQCTQQEKYRSFPSSGSSFFSAS